MRELKVLYIAPEDFYETGGTRRPLEVIRRIERYGVEPYVIQPPTSDDRLADRVSALRSVNKMIPTYKLGRCLKGKNFDLIVSTSEAPETTIPGYLLSRKLEVPWTTVFQLPIDLKYTPASTTPIFKDPLWMPQQLMVSFAVRNTIPLTVSKAPVLGSTIGPNKYITINIPNGVNWELIRETEPYSGSFDAIFLARLTSEKGIFDVLNIWKRVVDAREGAHLVVAGNFQREGEKEEFFNKLKKLDLEKNITYKGFLDESEKFSHIKAADIMIYPSRLDAFPIVVLEALACGTPVVAYDLPFITSNYWTRAVKTVGEGNIEAYAGKVLDTLLLSEAKIQEYSSLSRKYAEKFTWDEVAKSEAKAYEKFLNSIESHG